GAAVDATHPAADYFFVVGGASAANRLRGGRRSCSRPLKNVGEAGKTIPMAAPQKRPKKALGPHSGLRAVNEHFDWARTRGRFKRSIANAGSFSTA
ncbi:MAG: hypothetical protein ACK563_04500, partial [Pseudomonadaceae bacterium]